MKNKGIATRTILLLAAGIIAVGVIIYLVYMVSTGPTLSIQECKTKIIQYCTLCANIGWRGPGVFQIITPQELVDCGIKYPELSAWSDNHDNAPGSPGNCDIGPNSGDTERECEALGAG